jgi:hypothetical protein
MKKCPGCEREIDKYGVACDYCGKLTGESYEKNKRNSPAQPGSRKHDQGRGGHN